MNDKQRSQQQIATTEDQQREAVSDRPARKRYVRPSVTDAEPLANVTLVTGGQSPSSTTPFVGG